MTIIVEELVHTVAVPWHLKLKTLTFETHGAHTRARAYSDGYAPLVCNLVAQPTIELASDVVGTFWLFGMGPTGYSHQVFDLGVLNQTVTLQEPEAYDVLSEDHPIIPDPPAPHSEKELAETHITVLVGGVAPDSWKIASYLNGTLEEDLTSTRHHTTADAWVYRLGADRPQPFEYASVRAHLGEEVYAGVLRLVSGKSQSIVADLGTGEVTHITYPMSKVSLDLGHSAGIALDSPAPQLQVYSLEVQVTREGEPPLTPSTAKVYLDESTTVPSALFYLGPSGSQKQYFSQAILGEWYVAVMNLGEPRMGSLRWPVLTERDNVLRFDLSEGTDGGNTGGDKGLVHVHTYLEGRPAERDVVVVEQLNDGTWRMVGFGKTDATGAAAVEVKVLPDTKVFGLVPDDYGFKFVPNQEVVVGDRVRPSEYRGWLYQITAPGVLPADEPGWWPAVGENAPQELGTARAIAIRYYQPIGHGPFPVEML